MKKEDSLKKRYSIKLLAGIIGGIISALLIAIVPKALGPIAYGQFIYLQNFFTQAIGFLDMGSSTAFFTKISARHDRKELITFYLIYSLLILCLILGFIFSIDKVGFTSYFLPNIPNEYIYFGVFFAFFSWITQTFIKISDAYALTVSVELIKIVYKILSLLLLLSLIYFTPFDLYSYFTFHYISLISFLIILALLFIKKDIFKNILTFQIPIFKLIKEFIEYCHPLFVYSVMSLMAGMFDIWLLQKYGGSEQTGFYGLAFSLATVCFIFTSTMTPIITREFARFHEQKNLNEMKKLYLKYVPMLYSFAAFFGVFVSIQSEIVLAIFTDGKFKEAYWVLFIMAFYPIHQTYGQLSGSIFYATGQTKIIRNIAFITIPIGMLLSFGFIYLLDLAAIGLAYKMILGQIISTNIQLYYNAKFLGFSMKPFLLHQLYSLVFFIVLAYIASSLFSSSIKSIEFLFSGFLYTILVIIFSFIYPKIFSTSRKEIKNIKNTILNKISKGINN